ncbi:hypothetical protein BOTCAL_0828g00010 [Botryotinia calthae]|uniref:Uncharacterized protein n=1 Tax=Botryotinia calthae TaxID=38488 RepID=A0A4Y8CI99_9HELO|nr:hypothetical protein BOTCAL_0828g00010 [Botryotinia calthae]
MNEDLSVTDVEEGESYEVRRVGEEYWVQVQVIIPPPFVDTIMKVTQGNYRYTLWKDLLDDKARLGISVIYLEKEEL